MRLLNFALLVLVAVTATGAIAEPLSTAEPTAKLYTDEQIRKLSPVEIGEQGKLNYLRILDHPCLEVVPAGETQPRKQVFQKLGIEDSHLQDFRHWPCDKIEFLLWQVSPSYDICCMANFYPREDHDNPERKVYGIRLLKRPQK